MKKSTSLRRRLSLLAGSALLLTTALFTQGCLQRPVKEQTPNTSNVFVERVPTSTIKTIDMLFVIDNSVSMGDKQTILKVAVPKMVERLVAPNCVDENGAVIGTSTLQGQDRPPVCDQGKLEFNPVSDIHLGVVSSSLGAHGAVDRCPATRTDQQGNVWNEDDKGMLVPTVRPIEDKGENGLGFLAWNGGDEAAARSLNERFAEHVAAAGELGCGFEATLEAWYRFLVDPAPPANVVKDPMTKQTYADGVQQDVLNQRAAFLRPEGLLAIVVLSDENDCSIMDGGDYYNNAKFGYLLASDKLEKEDKAGSFNMPAATAICETNPNDACCLSCLQRNNVPEACADAVAAACNPGGDTPALDDDHDAANMRCFANKKRFGVDLLYPTQRYVDALTRTSIIDARTGNTVDNPIFRSGGKVRDLDRVFFAGIVGVPWQDIATPESLDPENPDTMRYLRATELADPDVDIAGVKVDRWEVILGQPNLPATSKTCQDQANPACGVAPSLPLDPFMIEQIEPRMVGAVHPIATDQSISSPDSNDPQDNKINGHEYNTGTEESSSINDDLQYACIFPLTTPKEEAACAASVSCDCAKEAPEQGPSRNRPLCQPPGGGAPQKAQYWAKAYPGTRILQVLRDFGENSIVGSICPKVVDDQDKADYGYNPAVQAIVDRLAEKLIGTCLPREVTLDANGQVPCFVVETKAPRDASDPSDTPLVCGDGVRGRREVSETVGKAVRAQLAQTGYCSDENHKAAAGGDCSAWQMCEVVQLTEGTPRSDCLYNTAPADTLNQAGYCYIDPKKQDVDGEYIAGGSKAEADAANFGNTVRVDGTNTLVDGCPSTERRILRFVGDDTPAEGTITMVACSGDAAGADEPILPAPTPSGDTTTN